MVRRAYIVAFSHCSRGVESLAGVWRVAEYNRRSSRTIKLWRFESYAEADEFRRRREEFYRIIGLEKTRALTDAYPEIAREEIELFAKIIQSPRLLQHVKRAFNLL